MGSTPVCQITAAGCARPTFADCLTYVQSAFRAIYGQDVYLGADCQDGQFCAVLAQAIHDANGETLAAYQAFSPATAVGAGLDIVAKINGIRRKSASTSTCDFLNIGQADIAVTGGVLRDAGGYLWTLPDFTFPLSGQITVTGTCQTIGSVTLPAGALATAAGLGMIATPIPGWQSATNLSPATPGAPVETDTQLRTRQALSTSLASATLLTGTLGALAALSGVTRVKGYENDGNALDGNGQPGHTVAFVVEGGDAAAIAALIALKKGPGVGTFGSTIQTVADQNGIPKQIAFIRPKAVTIRYVVDVRALSGFSVDVKAAVAQALATWTNALDIGATLYRTRAYAPALLPSDSRAGTFELLRLLVSRDGRAAAEADLALGFDEAATCDPANVLVRVTAGL